MEWTRIIEHKWFEFGKDAEGNDLPKTVISREFSSEWEPGDEPYYPVNDAKNGALYVQYIEDKDFFRKYGNPVIIRTGSGDDCVAMSAQLYDRIAEKCGLPETKELIEREPRT